MNDPTPPLDETLYSSERLRVRLAPGWGEEVCFVAFSPFTDVPCLDRPGFGEVFFRRLGLTAVHVVNRDNRWYSEEDIPLALAAIAKRVERFRRIVTYGSSMGGYAAIRFAEELGAGDAIAISPQYGVSKMVAPFEHRWRSLLRDYPELEQVGAHASRLTRPIVFYDPYDPDRLHFDLIADAYPLSLGIPLPNAGHPAGALLSETGALEAILRAVAMGRFDSQGIAEEVRRRRRQSGQYLFTLARRQPPKRMALKLSLAEAAVNARHDAAYMIYASLLREKCGEISRAAELLDEAIETLPDHPAPLYAGTVFALRRGRFQKAVKLCSRLLSLAPDRRNARLYVVSLAASGQEDEAKRHLKAAEAGLLLRASFLFSGHFAVVANYWRLKAYSWKIQFGMIDEWDQRRRWLNLNPKSAHRKRGS